MNDYFLKAIEKSNINNDLKKKFLDLNDGKINIDKSIYNTSWLIIHQIHVDPNELQLYFFLRILKLLPKMCPCREKAHGIFYLLLDSNVNNFLALENTKNFWCEFHNRVNFDLGKPLYSYFD